MSADHGQGLSRRAFLRTTGTAGVTVLGSSAALSMLSGCPSGDPNTSYTTHQKETMEALADTVIPGYYYVGATRYTSDPAAGGAVQAGAWNVYWDTYYGMNGWIDEAVDDLGSSFKTASLSSRTSTLNSKLAGNTGPWYSPGSYLPIYRGTVLLAKLAFFGAVINTTGTAYLGFPGPSSGYAPLPSNPYP